MTTETTPEAIANDMVTLWLTSCLHNPGTSEEDVGKQRASFVQAAAIRIAEVLGEARSNGWCDVRGI